METRSVGWEAAVHRRPGRPCLIGAAGCHIHKRDIES